MWQTSESKAEKLWLQAELHQNNQPQRVHEWTLQVENHQWQSHNVLSSPIRNLARPCLAAGMYPSATAHCFKAAYRIVTPPTASQIIRLGLVGFPMMWRMKFCALAKSCKRRLRMASPKGYSLYWTSLLPTVGSEATCAAAIANWLMLAAPLDLHKHTTGEGSIELRPFACIAWQHDGMRVPK